MSSGNGHDKPPGKFLVFALTDLAPQQVQDALDLHAEEGYELVTVDLGLAYMYKEGKK